MTLIEVLIAAVVLALAALATFGVLAAATRNAQRAQATQVALDKAQEEVEKLHALTYSQLAMTVAPDYDSSPRNPDNRVSGANFDLQKGPAKEDAEMVINIRPLYGGGFVEGGVVTPGPLPFEEGNVRGELYRYVVWRNDPTCPESEVGTEDFCPGGQDYKQIVVIAKLDRPVGQIAETGYVEVQSQVANPATRAQRSTQGTEIGSGGSGEGSEEEEKEREEEEEGDTTGGLSSGKSITAQQFFLSDTPCSSSGSTTREGIVADHLLHNTLGTCASGLRNGQSQNGAPDALLLGSPPDPDPVDESNPALHDYSSDSYLEPTPDTDKGVQILHDDTAGCHFKPTSTVHPEAKVHRWVTDPLPKNFKLNGAVTLEFYSRTLNEASYPGTLCAFLFQRHETGSGEATTALDTLLKNSLTAKEFWTFSSQGNESWPRNAWTRLRLTMNITGAPLTIPAGDRLGIALSVDPATTPADAIPIMYDHPNYPTRIEVDTTTPLEGS